MAAGPPTAIAIATPDRFPTPTCDASDTQNAWKEEMFLPVDDLCVLPPSRRNISLRLNCTKRVRIVKCSPVIHSRPITMYVHIKSLAEEISELNVSIW